jgi:hypothetical protein
MQLRSLSARLLFFIVRFFNDRFADRSSKDGCFTEVCDLFRLQVDIAATRGKRGYIATRQILRWFFRHLHGRLGSGVDRWRNDCLCSPVVDILVSIDVTSDVRMFMSQREVSRSSQKMSLMNRDEE